LAASSPASKRWGALALLLGLACHRPAATQAGSRPAADAVTDRVRVFLISPGDGGQAGPKVGCGDSAVPIEVRLARPRPALSGALEALLAMRGNYDGGSGLINALYASSLTLAGIERSGAVAKVHLSGYIELAGACENSRMLGELTETALQFGDVARAQFVLDGQPLRDLVQESAALAGPPAAADAAAPAASPEAAGRTPAPSPEPAAPPPRLRSPP
jgi:hypothetical protein